MKNTKFSKITLLVLSLALVFGSIVPMTVSAETTEATKPEIISQNVSYSTNLAVKLAVKADTATAPIKLYRYDSEPAVGEVGELVATSSEFLAADSAVNNLPADSYVIQAPGVAASAIAHYYYYKVIDANGNESDVFRYSVAEYLYERLATSGISDTQKTLYNATIAYGDAAQVHFASTDTRVSTLNLVTVDGGVLNDGYAKGVYAIDTVVTPTGAGVTEWTVTVYKDDGTNETKYISSTENFTVAGRTEVVAGHVISYRAGTDTFENNGENIPSYISQIKNNATASIVDNTVYGETSKVLKINLPQSTAYVRIERNDTTTAASAANAYEVSFDFKSDLATGTSKSLKIMIDNSSYSALYSLYFNSDGVLKFYNTSDSAAGWAIASVDPTAYNNICLKVVSYEEADSTNFKLHIYVNGTELAVHDVESTVFTSLADIKFIRIQGNNTGDIYLDNLYVGYVKD